LIRGLLSKQERVRIIFAAAPSQNEFLDELAQAEGIDWSRITAFHMDEYIGLPANAPQLFSQFLIRSIFSRVYPGEVELIGDTTEIEEECRRYSELLKKAPIDLVFLGIGENGHLAFNDPPVANFTDPKWVKLVELDELCRIQQVNDGCFPDFKTVPKYALTLTIPALTSAKHLFCMVPGPTKRAAVKETLQGEISTRCPATILRKHVDCKLYVDMDSYKDCLE
jgi:glucosamine-6-phosphate deaminase